MGVLEMKKKLLLFFVGILLFNGCSVLNINQREKKLDSGEYSFIRGMNYYQKGNSEKAMEEYLKAYKKTPRNTTLLKEIGLLYGENNNIEEAINFFTKAYKINKKDIENLKNLSYLYYLKKDYKKSNKFLDEIVKFGDNQDAFVLKMRGYISSSNGNYKKAYNHLSMVNIFEYDKEYFDELIKVYSKLDKINELYEKIGQNYESYKSQKNFILQYISVESQILGNHQEAIKKLLQFISLNGGDDQLYLKLTDLYIKEKNHKKAKLSFSLVPKSNSYKKEYQNIEKLLK